MPHVAAELPETWEPVQLPVGRALERVTQPRWKDVIELERLLHRVTRVAREELIAAIACEDAIETVLLRAQGAVIGGEHRRVAEWLIEGRGELRYRRGDLVGREIVFVVDEAEMTRRDPRVRHLVVSLGRETDRIRVRGHSAKLRQHAGYGRAVCTAA